MELSSLPRAARWYVLGVIGLGGALMLAAAGTQSLPWSPWLLLWMAAAALLASQKLVLVGRPGEAGSLTHRMSTLSLGFPVVLGALLWHGPIGGMLVAVASAAGASFFPRRHPFYRLAFTSVNLGAAALLSGWLMERLGLTAGSPLPLVPLALLAGTLLYYLVNTVTVCVAVALSQRTSPWSTWRGGYLWTAPSFLAGAAVVAMAHALHLRFGGAVALLSLLCLYLVHGSYRCYLERLHQLEVSEERLQEVCMAAVESLALAIDAKDGVTHSRVRRVQQVALALAEHVGVTHAELQAIRVGSLTHDVGKLAVPDTILSRAGRLNPEEFERVKAHVAVGVRILEPVRFPWPVVEVVRSHHERWDGNGYPAGLRGEEIPIGGRIVAIADVFDALTAPRPYRGALSYDEAHALICAGSGTQFDPRLVEAFSALYPDLVAALQAADAECQPGHEGLPSARAAADREANPETEGTVWDKIRGASQETISVAFTDSLTGLGNGRHLASALQYEMEAAERGARPLSLLMMDLDGFKAINDQYGHLTGNSALQSVAGLLKESLRDDSVLCRYAGDEFVALLPGANREQATRVADRLRDLIDRCAITGVDVPLGLSIGCATFPMDAADADTLLGIADAQMYADKARRKAAPCSIA